MATTDQPKTVRRFSDLPPTDRWAALDLHLPEIIARHIRAAEVDPAEEIPVADLAKRHGISVQLMLRRLRDLEGRPYALGSAWFIRKRDYVRVLEGAELCATKPVSRRKPTTTTPNS